MNYFLKYRFAIWTIVILSVIIISSLSTVFILKYTHKNDLNERQRQIGHFFKEELKLTPEQEKVFKASRMVFFSRAKSIFDSLENKRYLMVQELCKPVPDSMVLYKLSDEIGSLHGSLKRVSIRNLLNLRSICTPEQIKKLNTINGELIGPDGPMHRMRPNRGEKRMEKPH